MRNQFLIPVFSFCDSISNSSSEVFLASGNQTISTIKQIIEQLVDIYNSESELYNLQNRDKEHFWARRIISQSEIWTDIFREPKIAEFEITVPEKVKELDRYYNTDWSINNSNWIANREFNFRENEIKINEELGQYFDSSIKYPDQKLYESNRKLYDKQAKIHSKYSNKINKIRSRLEKKYHKKWYKYCELQLIHMWQLNCAQNDIKFKDLGEYSFNYWSDNVNINFERNLYKSKNPLPENIKKFIEEVYCCESYKFDIKKGSIILDSARDNSIPGALMEKVESILSAKRIHIG